MKPLRLSTAVGIGVFALALLGVAAAATYFGLLSWEPSPVEQPVDVERPERQVETQPTEAFTREELQERVKTLLEANPMRPEERDGRSQPALPNSSVELLEDVASKLSYFSESEMTKFLKTPGMAEVDLMRVPYVADLETDLLKLGCPFVDCIPSIDVPGFETPEEASDWLRPDDLVLAVSLNGISRAYPVKILNWHEIVNDGFGDEFIAITYCPLCNSGVAFRRTLGDRALEFGVSGRLYKSNLIMYDRQTGSFWNQIEGRALVGPLAGQQLERLPIDVLPWSAWRAAHPNTTVLARPTTQTPVGGNPPLAERRKQARRNFRPIGGGGNTSNTGEFLRDYDVDPYAWYRVNDADTFGTPFQDRRLAAKAEVWGLTVNGQPKAYHGSSLQRMGALNDDVGGEPVLLIWANKAVRAFERRLSSGQVLTFERDDNRLVDRETRTRWTLDGRATEGPLADTQLRPIVTTASFWFAWVAFHPETEFFVDGAEVDEGDGDSTN